MTIAVSTLDGDTTKVEDDELDDLTSRIRGDVLVAGDEGFDANPIYNAMHGRRPALKVRPTGTADVVEIVNFARESGTCWSRSEAAATPSPGCRVATVAW